MGTSRSMVLRFDGDKELEAAFNALQAELEEVIADRIKDTQSQLLENFDEDVHDRLKLRLQDAEARLDKLGRWFWGVTCFALDGRARFEPTRGHHHHFACRSCDRVFGVEGCRSSAAALTRGLPEGFLLEGHDVWLHGLCAECAAA